MHAPDGIVWVHMAHIHFYANYGSGFSPVLLSLQRPWWGGDDGVPESKLHASGEVQLPAFRVWLQPGHGKKEEAVSGRFLEGWGLGASLPLPSLPLRANSAPD